MNAFDAPDFRGNALCAETDPDAFFPDKGGSTKQARDLCDGDSRRLPCPVRDECLKWALDNDERFGVWGGKSEDQRRRIRRRRSAA